MGSRRLLTTLGVVATAFALAVGGFFVGGDRQSSAGGREIRLQSPPEQHDETQGVYRRDLVLIDDPTITRIFGPDGRVLARRRQPRRPA